MDIWYPTSKTAYGKPTREEIDAANVYHENLVREEADAIMIILMVQSEDEESLKLFHDQVGHSVFVALALTNDENDHVDKVHRYFGHRSERRIWDLFS